MKNIIIAIMVILGFSANVASAEYRVGDIQVIGYCEQDDSEVTFRVDRVVEGARFLERDEEEGGNETAFDHYIFYQESTQTLFVSFHGEYKNGEYVQYWNNVERTDYKTIVNDAVVRFVDQVVVSKVVMITCYCGYAEENWVLDCGLPCERLNEHKMTNGMLEDGDSVILGAVFGVD